MNTGVDLHLPPKPPNYQYRDLRSFLVTLLALEAAETANRAFFEERMSVRSRQPGIHPL